MEFLNDIQHLKGKRSKRTTKKVFLCVFAVLMIASPLLANAYDITDPIGDAIGVRTFEGYGIDIYNLTPGTNSGAIYFDLFTNYPQAGLLVGAWDTKPADLFLTEIYHGARYSWVIPPVNHGAFSAGTLYAVGTYLVSDAFEPQPPGGYIYNHNIPVRIDTIGNNYGYTSFGGGTVTWNNLGLPGSPDYRIRVTTSIFEDDPNGELYLLWATATCANEVIAGPIPEPATMLLLGSGLLGLNFARRKFGLMQNLMRV